MLQIRRTGFHINYVRPKIGLRSSRQTASLIGRELSGPSSGSIEHRRRVKIDFFCRDTTRRGVSSASQGGSGSGD